MGVLEGMNIISMSNEFNIFAQSHKLIYNINDMYIWHLFDSQHELFTLCIFKID